MPLAFQDVLKFWFEELQPSDHFKKNPDLDKRIQVRFQETLEQAGRGELFSWRETASGRLAEIIVLDQFPRNIHRDTPMSFAFDSIALVLAQELVESGGDLTLPPERRAFAYMPYMHSESKPMHEIAVTLFSQPGLENNLKFEKLHKTIIDRFGRYPHRNQLLGRTPTTEEVEFLKSENSSF